MSPSGPSQKKVVARAAEGENESDAQVSQLLRAQTLFVAVEIEKGECVLTRKPCRVGSRKLDNDNAASDNTVAAFFLESSSGPEQWYNTTKEHIMGLLQALWKLIWASALVTRTTIGELCKSLNPKNVRIDASSFLAAHGPEIMPKQRLKSSIARLILVLMALAAVAPVGHRASVTVCLFCGRSVYLHATIVLINEIVFLIMQVYFEVGPGSCLAKDMARQVGKEGEAGMQWVQPMKDKIFAKDYWGAAWTMSRSDAFRERMHLQNSFVDVFESLRCELPCLRCMLTQNSQCSRVAMHVSGRPHATADPQG